MATNPELASAYDGSRVPAPFQNEIILCQRSDMQFVVQGADIRNNKWSAKGTIFISNMRMVFISKKDNDGSGLHAFDLPLLYIRYEKFHQPIFGCNHLAGECWPVSPTGGPGGSSPPYKWKLNFLTGGVGTLLPIFYRFLKAVREAEHDRKRAEELANHGVMQEAVNHAFVDPNDPTTLYLTQPVGDDSRLQNVPVYASNYGKDEAYAPLV